MYNWLEHFEVGNRVPFVSDGNPNVITIPGDYEEVLNEKYRERVLIYEP